MLLRNIPTFAVSVYPVREQLSFAAHGGVFFCIKIQYLISCVSSLTGALAGTGFVFSLSFHENSGFSSM